jgi:hypothetical protein
MSDDAAPPVSPAFAPPAGTAAVRSPSRAGFPARVTRPWRARAPLNAGRRAFACHAAPTTLPTADSFSASVVPTSPIEGQKTGAFCRAASVLDDVAPCSTFPPRRALTAVRPFPGDRDVRPSEADG